MASYDETLVNITLDAHADIAVDTSPPYEGTGAGFQYRFVKVSGDHQCNLYDGTETGDIAVGVLQSKPQVTEMACTVAIAGISMVEAGDTITGGEAVEGDDEGRAIPLDGGVVLGTAIYGGAEGELIPVLLRLTSTAVPA